jgi:isopentenyl phosphate kinase
VDRVVKAGWLATLVSDVFKVLVDLGMPTIPVIPQDPCTAGDVLEVVDVILEFMKEAYDSGNGPWD